MLKKELCYRKNFCFFSLGEGKAPGPTYYGGMYSTICNADNLFILTVLHRSMRRYKAIKIISLPSRARALMSSLLITTGTAGSRQGKTATAW